MTSQKKILRIQIFIKFLSILCVHDMKVSLYSLHDIYVQDAERRAEYGEMNVQRIHLQIDQLEDELIAQKLKCKAINDELQQTFTEMSQLY